MLKPQDIQIIQDFQRAGIAHKTLVREQLELIYDHNWFNIWVPNAYGGAAKSLPEGAALLEELAYWDGSFAWTVTLCSGANMFAGFIDQELAKAVFANREVCFGGSGRVGGKAVWDGQRYFISGEWQYATGAPHLTHFTLNSFIYHGDEQQFDTEGNPLVYSFFVPKDDVLIHYDWDTFGLESTASHSFSLINKPIDASYHFQLKPAARVSDEPLFRVPFRPFADVTLLVNYLGMYRRFLDLIQKYFFDKSKDPVWEEKFSKQRFRVLDGYQQQL
jgi:alkylation response protein AidB-like acyl-CoA dehydrogenase